MTRSHRRVSAAVDAVCDMAATSALFTLEGVIDSIARERGRAIIVEEVTLPPGVCGQRRAYLDRDVIAIAHKLPNYEHTLAHELGHVVFRHLGVSVEDNVNAISQDLLAYMLAERNVQSAVFDGENADDEWEAEVFAGHLLQRLRRMNTRGSAVSVVCYDQALG